MPRPERTPPRTSGTVARWPRCATGETSSRPPTVSRLRRGWARATLARLSLHRVRTAHRSAGRAHSLPPRGGRLDLPRTPHRVGTRGRSLCPPGRTRRRRRPGLVVPGAHRLRTKLLTGRSFPSRQYACRGVIRLPDKVLGPALWGWCPKAIFPGPLTIIYTIVMVSYQISYLFLYGCPPVDWATWNSDSSGGDSMVDGLLDTVLIRFGRILARDIDFLWRSPCAVRRGSCLR